MINSEQPEHLQVISTADGSKTIYNAIVGENYHSRHGALQESLHVFIKSGLEYFLENSSSQKSSVSILEVGFGTGLNFLLTADYCTNNNINLKYTGIEAYPLNETLINKTGYEQYLPAAIWGSFLQLYNKALVEPIALNNNVKLQINIIKLENFTSQVKYDVIYFDAFAAIHQPEMWNEEAIAHTIKFLKPGGVFVSYAITGNLKRTIKALGLKVQKAPGAPGKREMLRAIAGE